MKNSKNSINFENSAELYKTLKSLWLNSKKAGQSKIYLKEDDIIRFEPKSMQIFFKLPILSWQGKKLPNPTFKFNSEKTKMIYKKLWPNIEEFELLRIKEDLTNKLRSCLDVSKRPGMDEISPKFLKDGAEVLTKPICDII